MNSVLKFLQAARNLSKQGVKKEEILEFAKREFGEITDYMKNAVDDIYSRYAASPLQKILEKRKAAKQSVDERKVLDMDGNVIDPNEPIIGGKQDKGITTLEKEFAPELNPDYLKLKKRFLKCHIQQMNNIFLKINSEDKILVALRITLLRVV